MKFFDTMSSVWKNIEKVAKVWTSVGEWVRHKETLDEDLQVLRRKMKDLSSIEEDINQELESLEYCNNKKRKREVENWLRNVQRTKNEAWQVEQEVQEKSSTYLPRLSLQKLVQKNIQEASELAHKGRFPEGLVISVDQSKSERELITVPLAGQTTAKRNLEKIWGCLMNKETLSVGVYGMGGVGKTTIVTHIHNQLLKDDSSFDHVYWVTVSQQSSIYKLQNDIAKAIGLDLSREEDEKKRASMLFHRLRRSRKFVLILDDMWECFPEEKIGIPLFINGGKLLLTTRKFQVCQGMKCQNFVKVEPLSKEESWELFIYELGSGRVLAPALEGLAKSVTEECAGLPLAIVAVARSLRGIEDISDWKNALYQLKEPNKGLNDIENEVFRPLKFSYDRLDDERLQQCLLYCSLFPEDYKICRNDLIVYWIGEGLVDRMDSREAEFDRGNAMINRLINASLLERVEVRHVHLARVGRVKMHDVIRDMALTIARENPTFMVKAGVQLHSFPSEREWLLNLDRVSLMDNYSLQGCISDFSPSCPRLKTLLLQGNKNLRELPSCFLVNMESLSVLDLSRSISRLPDSIANLVKLRVLILRFCEELKRIPSLSKLQNLEELDLCGTRLEELPEGIHELFSLRALDISHTCMKESVPREVLQKLSQVQSLKLEGYHVEVELDALIGFSRLETLNLRFSDFHKLVSYFRTQHWQRLGHYFLASGSKNRAFTDETGYDNSKVVLISDCDSTDQWILPNNLQYLEINNCNNLTNLFDIFESLKDSKKRDTDSYIRSATDVNNMPMFRCKNHVGVQPLRSEAAFANLQLLTIVKCRKLKYLFTFSIAQNLLQNLVKIIVWKCSDLEEIIATDEEESFGQSSSSSNQTIVLPELASLELINLPKLNSIYKGRMVCHSLENIEVWNCGMLKRLPFSTQQDEAGEQTSMMLPPGSLKEIRGGSEWWDSLEWERPETKSILQPFVHLEPKFQFCAWK